MVRKNDRFVEPMFHRDPEVLITTEQNVELRTTAKLFDTVATLCGIAGFYPSDSYPNGLLLFDCRRGS
jgi:hypothetical protein